MDVPNPFAPLARAGDASAGLLFDVNPLAEERGSTVVDGRDRPLTAAWFSPGNPSSELSKRP